MVNEPKMLLWLAVRCNTERFKYAYATNHGRFGKTIKVNIIELLIICDYIKPWG